VKTEKQALKQAKERAGHVAQAIEVVQAVAEEVQSKAHRQIASVVTKCLEGVFGDECYTFKIGFEKKRGKTEANLLFVRDGQEIEPVDAAGGGTVDVASFALRVAALVLAQPRKRLFLALDEPFRFVSAEYRPAVREMLERLSKDLKVQVLMVTHSDEFRIGKVIEVN
jgi:DNA repair exonuclease SbcCD ATPase subunit